MLKKIGELEVVSTKILSPFTGEDVQDSEGSDLPDLQGLVEEKIWEAIEEDRYEDLSSLYDELLMLRIEELVEQSESLEMKSLEEFKIEIEAEITKAKSYYLILSGQPDKAIELCTSLIAKMQSSKANGLLFSDRELLQIRAAAYLLRGEQNSGLKDLKESGKNSHLSGLNTIFLKNSHFEDLSNLLFLQVLEGKLDTKLVEIKSVSLEELNSMADWERADYYLVNGQPGEALRWCGKDTARSAIAFAQLGRFDEAVELVEDFQPNTVALIRFLQGDLEAAEELADDCNSFSMQSIMFYLQSM